MGKVGHVAPHLCADHRQSRAENKGPKSASEEGMCWSRPEMRNAMSGTTGGEASDGRPFSAGRFRGVLARHAEPGHWQGLQAFVWDRRLAVLAVSVDTDLEPIQRGVDVGQDGLCSHCQGVGDLLSGRIF